MVDVPETEHWTKADSCGIQTGKLGIKVVHGIEFYQCKRASLDEVAIAPPFDSPALEWASRPQWLATGTMAGLARSRPNPVPEIVHNIWSFETLLQHLLSGFAS